MKSMAWAAAVGMISCCSLACAHEDAEEPPADAGSTIRVAVITGGHGFDKAPFLQLFESIEGIDFVHLPQKDDSEFLEDIENWSYDVIVLYNMSRTISEKRRENFNKLLLTTTHPESNREIAWVRSKREQAPAVVRLRAYGARVV